MKNVCAPAVVIGDQIIIVGGKGSVSPSLSLPLPRSCEFSEPSCLGCSLKKHLELWKERRSVPTLHTLLSWSFMVIEVEIVLHFVTPSSKTWMEETEEKPMQVTVLQKGGSQEYGGPAPLLLTHSLVLPVCSSWKNGKQSYHKAMDGLSGWVGYRSMRCWLVF